MIIVSEDRKVILEIIISHNVNTHCCVATESYTTFFLHAIVCFVFKYHVFAKRQYVSYTCKNQL